ncbi:MAG: hypothetical protein BHW33_06740 [Firmicutes bacterium CAG:137_57_8]|nr:MAG: hypothetical protein BHW33_06740 [Firmicutes bacterium CAG:137_57_8]
MSVQNENRCNFHPHTGWKLRRFYIFKAEYVKRKMRFVYTQAQKTCGVSRGKIPLALGSDRGGQHPCWHTAFHHESLVRYYTFVEQMATGNVAHH